MPETNDQTKRILVVDDHPIVRQGIRSLLEHEGDLTVCCEAENAAAAIDIVTGARPDVAVIDISLEGTDGVELTKAIRAQRPTLPILIMSMHDESLYAERALRAGANGYVMKQEVAEKIVEAIRHVLRGEVYVSEEIRQRILMGVRSRRSKSAEPSVTRLSDRELEVFRLIGQGCETRQIAAKLHLSVKTIETYRAHIKDKLNLESATELVRFAVQWVEHEDNA
jgi:DNA-binding NarL/FixJ family response regulator